MNDEILDCKYLPFTEDQLLHHIAKVKVEGECITPKENLDYYRNSVKRYHEYLANNPDREGKPVSEMRHPCQVERDERIWLASCMMTMYYYEKRQQMLEHLFIKAFGDKPPVSGLDSWSECLAGNLELYFEANLPPPDSYSEWLSQNLHNRHLIRHVFSSANGKKNLEEPTKVDALLINPGNGFAVIVEAKVLSDISYQTPYDATRNELARAIDVMLEENDDLCEPLCERIPEKSLVLLLTPEMFKNNPTRRLYGYKLLDYKQNPNSMPLELSHRKNQNWEKVLPRLGWLTWEDFYRTNNDCCSWLSDEISGCEEPDTTEDDSIS
ncbi:MAG: hypothetical protein ACOC38_04340 [Promethearchaeia archaeon]